MSSSCTECRETNAGSNPAAECERSVRRDAGQKAPQTFGGRGGLFILLASDSRRVGVGEEGSATSGDAELRFRS